MDIKVNTAELAVRSVKLTRSLLKQIRTNSGSNQHVDTTDFRDENGKLKKECVVGWIHGSVLGSEHAKYALVSLGKGDWMLVELWIGEERRHKQIYVP
jgi:hypothetical protein